ncbi:MAG: SDR family NAD(P)-dependent oxidoreductase [Lentisphaerae bacterium]|nr:SDR family NAD(P)-dependent oxidoreductase [Lentisphaerota bacterium]
MSKQIKRVLITGANSGLGKECARQFAEIEKTETIILGCRNPERAEDAKAELEETTGRKIFEILTVDVSDVTSARAAVGKLDEPVDALVMNAGGVGGEAAVTTNQDGVLWMFATNVLGHAALLEELLASKNLTGVALYAGSEAARGVPKMGLKRPKLESKSVSEFASIIDGSFFGPKADGMYAYGVVKYVAAQYMASAARKHPEVRIITMSPGSTGGTAGGDDLPQPMKFMFKTIGPKVLPLFGLMHGLEKGAARYVAGVLDPVFETGGFFASKKPTLTGSVVEQGEVWDELNDVQAQDNAYEAVSRFIR